MQFENPTPTEGINVSDEHPLKEFAQLVIGIALVSLVAIWLLSLAAGWFAKQIPFSYEQSLVSDIELFVSDDTANTTDSSHRAKQQALQTIADRLSQRMDLPQGMSLTVHYSSDDMVNALATLGGNIVIFEGLLKELKSEDELAAVMAHEIAHVKLRHPIVAAGKGITIATLAAFVVGASGSTAGNWLVNNSAQLSLLQYSRRQESNADFLAAEVLQAEYGHIEGALKLFELFDELEGDSLISKSTPQIYRSHPFSEQRGSVLKKHAADNGWALAGPATNMPKPLTINMTMTN